MIKIAVIGLMGESVFLPVEHFHTGGETLEATSFYTEPGGKGFNQAIAAARFGASVSFMSSAGYEGYGEKVKEYLKKDNIRAFFPVKSDRTAYAVIMTDSEGRNRVTEYTGAKLEVSDLDSFKDEIISSDFLMLSNEVPPEVNEAAAELAYQNNVRIIMNPAPYHTLSKELKDKVWLFTPNEHETEGLDDYDNVIVTLGDKGCLIRSTNRLIPAQKVKAVDTTGAGDTFNGVLAVMLAEGKSLEESAEIACKACALGVTRRGAAGSIPYRKEMKIGE